jgi:hypothetical protein
MSNDINNFSIHWVLTLAIDLWRFGGPLGLQTPKVEGPLGVWRFNPSHFPSLLGFLLTRNLANPCLGCEPKARVATTSHVHNLDQIFSISNMVSKVNYCIGFHLIWNHCPPFTSYVFGNNINILKLTLFLQPFCKKNCNIMNSLRF